jgi:XTP/dITP diphosphohydrolase
VLATRNEGKKRELVPLLAPLGSRIVSLDELALPASPEEDAIEAYETFEGNALAKARWFHARTGLPCIADDSGLVVDALGGQPGVRSRRWSVVEPGDGLTQDEANNALLLASLRAADAGGIRGRSARYVCVAAFADATRELAFRGETLGFIVDEPRGAEGFGYDPYFWAPELARTFAEATIAEKASVSHRGRAVRALCAALLA